MGITGIRCAWTYVMDSSNHEEPRDVSDRFSPGRASWPDRPMSAPQRPHHETVHWPRTRHRPPCRENTSSEPRPASAPSCDSGCSWPEMPVAREQPVPASRLGSAFGWRGAGFAQIGGRL